MKALTASAPTAAAETMVRYGDAGSAAQAFGHVRVTTTPLPDVVERLRQAITTAGLWVLHEIDVQAVVARAGHRIAAARQILFFHPDLMVRLLGANPAALPEAPLKFAVMAMPDGTVTIRWFDPGLTLQRYEDPALAGLGQELAAICLRAANEVVEDG